MHPPINDTDRIESAKRIITAQRTISPTGARRVHIITTTIPSAATTRIDVIARYASPIIVINALFWCSQTPDPTIMADILISSDTETDANAETRDDKLSGSAGIGLGTYPNQQPLKIDYHLTILRAPIVLKAIHRTGVAAPNTIMSHVLIEYA